MGVTRLWNITIVSLAVMLASSCMIPFLEGNLFEQFDGPPSADSILGRYSGDDGVPADQADSFIADLTDAAGSPRFFRDLTPESRSQLTDSLASVYSNTDDVEVETRQRAALLAADVNLRGTDAGETTNNLVSYFADGGDDPLGDPVGLLDAIIPESAQGDAAAIEAILQSYIAAADAYEAFGTTLGGDDPPDGTNLGSVAQNAAVAIAVKQLAATNGGADGLAASLANPDDEDELDTTGFDDILEEGSPLSNILGGAGLDGVFNNGD